jgi:ribonucleoside-diphosphate reductase alpha chain
MLKIEKLIEKRDVFDLTVEDNHTFYANGILIHNCTEIGQRTTPLGDGNSLLNLCTLLATNWGKFSKNLSEKEERILKDCCEMGVRALDALLDYQEYPIDAAERATKLCRPLGIGLIGYAHWLAKGRLQWGTDEALLATETMIEKQNFYLIQASNQLAKEFGSIELRTKYHDGIVPRDLNKIPVNAPLMPWDELKEDLKKYGIRNATLSTIFPSETSSQISNETNGIEPPRDLISIKGSKDGVLPQVVPEYNKLNHLYETLWNVDSKDYLKTTAVFQKYNDQFISCNTSYDPSKGEIKMSRLIEDLLFAYKMGMCTMYYNQVNDGSSDNIEEGGCKSGACVV